MVKNICNTSTGKTENQGFEVSLSNIETFSLFHSKKEKDREGEMRDGGGEREKEREREREREKE
jgi:hypothetical protein